MLAAEFFFAEEVQILLVEILHKIHQKWQNNTMYVSNFHNKWVLSICFIEKVPNLIQKITMQKNTEANWKEHEKSHFWRRLPCIFSVISKTIKVGPSEDILWFKCLTKDQILITYTFYAIICYVLGVRSRQKILVLYRRPFLGVNMVYFWGKWHWKWRKK